MFFVMLTITSRQMCAVEACTRRSGANRKKFAVRSWSWLRSASGIKIQSARVCNRGISVYLADFFQELVQGGKSDFEARALLIERLADFNTRLIPPLPPGEYLRLLNKIVEAKAPFHFSQPAAVEVAVEGEAVPASDLDRAIKWLAAKLRQDRTAKFADYQAECVETFKISKRPTKPKSGLPRARWRAWRRPRRAAHQGKNKSVTDFKKSVRLFSRADSCNHCFRNKPGGAGKPPEDDCQRALPLVRISGTSWLSVSGALEFVIKVCLELSSSNSSSSVRKALASH